MDSIDTLLWFATVTLSVAHRPAPGAEADGAEQSLRRPDAYIQCPLGGGQAEPNDLRGSNFRVRRGSAGGGRRGLLGHGTAVR